MFLLRPETWVGRVFHLLPPATFYLTSSIFNPCKNQCQNNDSDHHDQVTLNSVLSIPALLIVLYPANPPPPLFVSNESEHHQRWHMISIKNVLLTCFLVHSFRQVTKSLLSSLVARGIYLNISLVTSFYFSLLCRAFFSELNTDENPGSALNAMMVHLQLPVELFCPLSKSNVFHHAVTWAFCRWRHYQANCSETKINCVQCKWSMW